MAPRISLAHLTVLGCTPAQATHIAAETGYDFVSFRTMALGLPGEPAYALHSDPVMLRQTKAALAATGLTLLDIEVARISDDRQVADYLPALETAAELGAKHVLASGFGQDQARIAGQFAQLCQLAQPLGLTVDMEFMPFSDIKDLEQAHALVKQVACPNGGILIDTLHFDRSPSTLEQLDATPKRLFHYTQLNDAPRIHAPTTEQLLYTARQERLYLGEGVIPVREIMARLPGIPCALEIAHAKRQQELGYKEFARQCLLHAQRYFAS